MHACSLPLTLSCLQCTLGEPLTQEEFNLLMTKCQKDSDGTILYDTFVDMLISD